MTRFLCIVLIAFSFILAADGKVLIWEVTAPNLPGKAFLTVVVDGSAFESHKREHAS